MLWAVWGLVGRSEGKQRALVRGGWEELKMSQDIPPTETWHKVGSPPKKGFLGECIICRPALLPFPSCIC